MQSARRHCGGDLLRTLRSHNRGHGMGPHEGRHEDRDSWQRRDRHHGRLVSGTGRAHRHGGRPPTRSGHGDQLRQRRRGVAGLLGPMGRAGRAGEGHQVVADAPQPAGDPAVDGPPHVALGLVDAAQLHCRALPDQQGPHGAPGRVQPRLPAGVACRYRHRLRRAHPGHAAALPYPAAGGRHGRRHRGAAPIRRALRGAGHGWLRAA